MAAVISPIDEPNLVDVLGIPGIPIHSYLVADDYLSLERICKTSNIECPDNILSGLQSLRLLRLLQYDLCEIIKNRLRRTSIRITCEKYYAQAVCSVPIESLCLLKCLYLSSYTNNSTESNEDFFTTIKIARQKGLRVIAPDIDLYFTDPLIRNLYFECIDEIMTVSIDECTYSESLKYFLAQCFDRSQELKITGFTFKLFDILKDSFESLPICACKRPKITLDLTYFIRKCYDFETLDWRILYLSTKAVYLELTTLDEEMMARFREWVTIHPELLNKFTAPEFRLEFPDSAFGPDLKSFVMMFKKTAAYLGLWRLDMDLSSFSNLKSLDLSQIPDQALLPRGLAHLCLNSAHSPMVKVTEFDFAQVSNLVHLREISLISVDFVTSSVDMKRFRNLETLHINGSSKIKLGCLPDSLRNFGIFYSDMSGISITVNSPMIELELEEDVFNQIHFTDQVQKLIWSGFDVEISFKRPNIFQFRSLEIRDTENFGWLKEITPARFPRLEKIRIHRNEDYEGDRIQEQLVSDMFKALPKLQVFSFDIVFPGLSEAIARANPDLSVIEYNEVVEVERRSTSESFIVDKIQNIP
jgi:hypothetical protein